MAKSTSFQTGSITSVIIADEATPGTEATNAATRIIMPVTEYSFSETNAHTLSVAPFRTGLGGMTQSDDMVKWQQHDKMYEISLTFHSTAQAINRVCDALYGDGDGANVLLGNMPDDTMAQVKHGVSNTNPVTISFEHGSHDGLNTDMYFISCMCTSLSFSGDVGSNGGVVMATATFVTGYDPVEAAKNWSGGTETAISAQATMFNMHDMTTAQTLDGEDLVLFSFELNIAREVQRISFDSGNSFRPAGYSVGGYEVTGSLTCSRDSEIKDAIDNAAGMVLDLDTGVFQITAPKVFVEQASIGFDADGWKQTVPFRCTYDSAATSNPVVTINTAA